MRRVEIIVGGLILAALLGSQIVSKVWFSSALGEACSRERDCGFGLTCVFLGGYCSRECESAADCDEGFSCSPATARESRGPILDTREFEVLICVPPNGR